MFVSLIMFSGSSRSSPIPAIGMTLPQPPQQQQTHQPRGLNLGGYVVWNSQWLMLELLKKENSQMLTYTFFISACWVTCS